MRCWPPKRETLLKIEKSRSKGRKNKSTNQECEEGWQKALVEKEGWQQASVENENENENENERGLHHPFLGGPFSSWAWDLQLGNPYRDCENLYRMQVDFGN